MTNPTMTDTALSASSTRNALGNVQEHAGAMIPQEHSSEMRSVAGRRATSGSELLELEQHPEWNTLSRLPMRVAVGVPLPRFKVRDLLALSRGQLVLSAWASTTDVPLTVGCAQLSWAEFEVVEQRMAVRMTRLA